MDEQEDVVAVLRRLGGVADARTLFAATSRHRVRAALTERRIVRPRRGCYALPTSEAATAAAQQLTGVVSHLSAALAHGWAVKRVPDRPQVTVPANRNVDADAAPYVQILRGTREAVDSVTTPIRTVIDCARYLPFDEALAVADSALRCGDIARDALIEAADRSPRTGRPAARRIARAADGRARNPFESVVRAISLEVPGLHLVPQLNLVGLGQPDLYDEHLRLAVECDSFGFHSSREALRHDIERYNDFELAGVRLLRFGYEHAMDEPCYVSRCLSRIAASDRRAVGGDSARRRP